MSQSEVFEFLKKNPDTWFSIKEILKNMNIGLTSSSENLRRLRRSGYIIFKRKGKGYVYKYKKKEDILEKHLDFVGLKW